MTQATHEARIRNGINVDTLYGTLDAIKAQPELATFQFRATNTWMGGSHNRSTIKEFYGAGQTDQSRTSAWEIDAGEPPIFIDLRPAGEYERGRLPGARSLPIQEFRRRYAEIPRAGRVVAWEHTRF